MPDLLHTRRRRVPYGTNPRPGRSFFHRLIHITMAPPTSDNQQQRSQPDQLNQPPTFVAEQAFNATIRDLAQEMKKELNSIRNEFRFGAAVFSIHSCTQSSFLSQRSLSQPASQPQRSYLNHIKDGHLKKSASSMVLAMTCMRSLIDSPAMLS